MKSFSYTCFATLLITLAAPVMAASDSGTIMFRGAITNPSCNMDTEHHSVIFDCYNPASGQTVTTTADVMNASSLAGLPVEVNMEWINTAKTKGILSVSYL